MLSPDLRLALTFDDVLLVPGESELLPRHVDLQTRLDLLVAPPWIPVTVVYYSRTARAFAHLPHPRPGPDGPFV